jgi:Ankyrin repeats (many copies)
MTDRNDTPADDVFVWRGILDPEPVRDDVVSASHRLADAAKTGDWSTVFDLLDDPGQRVDINWWRPGGTAWFTVLHQAAWHGAPTDVAAEFLRRGALRSLRDSRGRTAYDIRCHQDLKASHPKGIAAQQRKSLALRERYLKPPPCPLAPADVRALDRFLAEVIDSRIAGVLYEGRDPQQVLRYPPVEILHEVPGQRLWFLVPGMYGAFDIRLVEDFLEVKSWSWVIGGSGQAHLITREGAILVEQGF